jgi:hypothetical protein
MVASWICGPLSPSTNIIVWLADGMTAFMGFLCVVLPATSAAAVGIGSYAEWRLLAEESKHMQDMLKSARRKIKNIPLGRSLASQDLGEEAYAVAALMLQDLEGWQRLFRIKNLEAS